MIETVCIHLIRYVIASLILAKNTSTLKLILPVLDKKGDKYNDQFTQFIEILGQTFTYDKIPTITKQIRKVLLYLTIGLRN